MCSWVEDFFVSHKISNNEKNDRLFEVSGSGDILAQISFKCKHDNIIKSRTFNFRTYGLA